MSVISAGTTSTTAFKVTGDTTGTLQLQTGAVPTTAINISASQVVTFPATTTLDFTGTLRLSGGTANGVLYLNGSKDVTGGSTLTFDGTTFTSGAHTLSTGVLTVPAGTVSAPAITTSGDTNTGIFFPAADTIAFTEGGVESMRLDSSGNLGLGVTPSAWTTNFGIKALQVGPSSAIVGSNNNTNVAFNVYFDGTNERYIRNGFASTYLQDAGKHIWSTAPSGTAGNAITSTTAMTLDASGRLVVGGTTATQNLTVASGYADLNGVRIGVDNNNDIYRNGSLFLSVADTLIFKTGGALSERARITSAGDLLVSTTTAITNVKFVVGGSISCQSTNGVIYFGNAGTPAGQANYGVNAAIGRSGGTNFHIAGSVEGDMCIAPEGTKSILFGTSGSANSTTERARITAAGDLLVGTTTSEAKLTVNGYTSSLGAFTRQGTTASRGPNVFNFFWTGGGALQAWVDASNVGNVTLSSDYRIKKNVVTQTENALARIAKLRPIVYELTDYGTLFKADGVRREGFIAHEVQEVIPSGAEGYKDEENRIQNLRADALLAVVVKAIQELSAKVAALESK